MRFEQRQFMDFALENRVCGFGQITLASGRESNWYANWRKISNDVFLTERLAHFVIDFALDRMLRPACFVGVPEGATKLGILTQREWAHYQRDVLKKSDFPTILPMIRANEKRHGSPQDRNYIGVPPNGSVVIEDVTTTADSLFQNVTRMLDAGTQQISAVTLLDRSGGEAQKRLASLDVPFYAMLTPVYFVVRAYQQLKPGDDIGRKVEKEFEEQGLGEIRLVKS